MSYYQQAFDVTSLPAWKALQEHRDVMQNFNMRRTFLADPEPE
jgi:glucose-6-phosphate isomerase